ncbi:4-hydroxy-2-oxoglutarate aldolase [Geomicrobium sp. JCM 19039]|nr:4-hydroxy-2-oxoglutarate aldolase [Geomicrobium sp. JCM 19039]
MIPGIFTPTEAFRAYEWGADIVKVFPADALGHSFLKGLQGPLGTSQSFRQAELIWTTLSHIDKRVQWPLEPVAHCYRKYSLRQRIGHSLQNMQRDLLKNRFLYKILGAECRDYIIISYVVTDMTKMSSRSGITPMVLYRVRQGVVRIVRASLPFLRSCLFF